MTQKSRASIHYIENDFPITDLSNPAWAVAEAAVIDSYWNAKPAPLGSHVSAKLLWSETYLYVLFQANRGEPLVINDDPVLHKKTMSLWDRDVCEIFIGPDKNEPCRYFEFEVAPTGEWIDLIIDLTSGERITDWEYISRMEAAAEIESDKVQMAMKVPFRSFGQKPKAGDIWVGNLFRCTGKDPDRGYLSWSPTMTDTPSFHEPERFGEFVFVR